MDERGLREHLRELLDGESAHASFERAVYGFPDDRAGEIVDGWAWSPWQLVEHVRIAEQDLLAYCSPGEYKSHRWPADYWPSDPSPPTESAWDESVAAWRRSRDGFLRLIDNRTISLFDTVPHSDSHTYLREILLAADHTAYHTGQLIAMRRAMGEWSE